MHAKKTTSALEHDFIMATYLAGRVVVYMGRPGVEATATSPQSVLIGMNMFLKGLEVIFRRILQIYIQGMCICYDLDRLSGYDEKTLFS